MLGNTLLSLFRPKDLEHIPERKYRQLIFQALVRRGDAAWAVPAVVGIVAAMAWIAAGAAVAALVTRGGGGVNWMRVGAVNVMIGGLVAFTVGSVVRWRMVTASIRRLINKAVCPYCEFSLMGLQAEYGGVVCPECGERVMLGELGLSPEDLHEAPNTPYAGAGRLGSYSGQVPEEKRIRALKRGEVGGAGSGAGGGGGGGRQGGRQTGA